MIFLMTILFLFAKRIYAPFSLFSMNGSIVSDPYSDMFQNTLFSSNHNVHKSSCGLCLGLQTLYSIDFCNLFQLKCLKPKNKGLSNFYEHCDVTEKVYLDCTAIS